jgi:hypothetical protein
MSRIAGTHFYWVQFVVLVIPRKCGKTSISSLVALYTLFPVDGEHRPEVILAAGFLKQTAAVGLRDRLHH